MRMIRVVVLMVVLLTACRNPDPYREAAPKLCPHSTLEQCGQWAADLLGRPVLWPGEWEMFSVSMTEITHGQVVRATLLSRRRLCRIPRVSEEARAARSADSAQRNSI